MARTPYLFLAAFVACSFTSNNVRDRVSELADKVASQKRVSVKECTDLYKRSKDDPTIFQRAPEVCHDLVEAVVLAGLHDANAKLKGSWDMVAIQFYGDYITATEEVTGDNLARLWESIDTMTHYPIQLRKLPDLYAGCKRFRDKYVTGIEVYSRTAEKEFAKLEERVPRLRTRREYQEQKAAILATASNLRTRALEFNCTNRGK